ncbi:hypothetical protein F4V57_01330 [Acinetobacter qingfengensis]|uniref:Outer membrane porin, OprD family n=1 Tax=Acinetobacter qingfengensis TaxID=1262585 RepID=A0A1E7R9M2_9GAMM|nr:hypothetical protein [Acinetobacter qingfengensis]KAA8735472.1 hypothetical protein F4V57_01330 [Acinetobacter qingfengensis]OEY95943.1 hypothetical protein BJI46_02920 [Acinetobacter qingfengensis]
MKKLAYSAFNIALIGMLYGASHSAWAKDTSLNHLFNLQQNCTITENSVDRIGAMFACGSVHGAVKTAYYSLNNAYFVNDLTQDTAVAGGYVKYETAPYYGVQLAVGYDLQRRLDDKGTHAEVSEFKEDRDGLAEAYVTWKNDVARVTIGNQRLNLPFVGDYADWRVLQALYQAADFQLGNQTDFLRLTKVNKFKSFAADEFTKTSRQSSTIETDGMWAIGVGKSYALNVNTQLKGQMWFQRYEDLTDLFYAEGSVLFPQHHYKPEIALQYLSGQDQGKAYAGQVDSQVIGAQVSLKLKPSLNLKLAYDYIKPEKNVYKNGALLTPYSYNTSSGPIFAQPFFTSTQDLGAGNAFMAAIDGKWNDQTILGARYSFMDLKDSDLLKSRNQSEYLLYGIYNFGGKLQGLSLSNFVGVQTSPRYDKNFWQNRLSLSYKF